MPGHPEADAGLQESVEKVISAAARTPPMAESTYRRRLLRQTQASSARAAVAESASAED